MSLVVHWIRRLILAALVITGSGASSLGAQSALRPFFDVQSSSAGPTSEQPASLLFAPGLSWQSARTSLWLRGAGELDGGTTRFSTADGQFRSTLFRVKRFDVGAGARVQHDELSDGSRYSRVNGDVRLSMGSAARGLSVGAGVLASSAPNARFATSTARVGGWFRALGLSLTGELVTGNMPAGTSRDTSMTRFMDSTWHEPPPDSAGNGWWSYNNPVTTNRSILSSRPAVASEARFGLYTRVAGLDVQGDAGMFLFQRGAPARSYGTLTVTRWLSPQLAAVFGGGVRALDPTFGTKKKPMAMLGLRFAPGRVTPHLVDAPPAAATGLAVSRSGNDVTIRLRAPGATSVELAGDFTKWSATPLARRSGDSWALTVPLKPGVYRLQVRIDEGEWAPPPGVSRAVDPYEGSVGVLVIS